MRCSLSSGTPAPVFLRASKTLAFSFRSPAQRLCFCDRWHITQGTLSDSQLHKQINFYYCFACLLSSYLIDSLITGRHCITMTLWGTVKGGCLEMIDSSLQCRFFLFYLFIFFTNLTRFFFCHAFVTFVYVHLHHRCEDEMWGINATLTQIPTWSCDHSDQWVIITQFWCYTATDWKVVVGCGRVFLISLKVMAHTRLLMSENRYF